MTREDCYKILVLLQTAYPRFYANKEKSELKNAVNLWADMFRKESAETVALAVKFLIANNTFPPSIAEIKQCIARSQTKDKLDEIQARQLVRKTLANSARWAVRCSSTSGRCWTRAKLRALFRGSLCEITVP